VADNGFLCGYSNEDKCVLFMFSINLPVIHVRNDSEPGGKIHEDVQPLDNEKVISKIMLIVLRIPTC